MAGGGRRGSLSGSHEDGPGDRSFGGGLVRVLLFGGSQLRVVEAVAEV